MTLPRRDVLLGSAALAGATLAAPAVRAQSSGRTLLLAVAGTPEGFDGDALRPFTQDTVVQCYEGLMRYGRVERDGRTFLDPDKIEGHLAEKWAWSADGKSCTITLRQGVKSPFGNELTAADVEWSWGKSLKQERTGAFVGATANVTAVTAASKYDVVFTLSAPSLILLSVLTLYVPGIYDSTEMKKHATPDDPWALKWTDGNTAGFGAYHLEQLRAGEQAVFVANPNYFRGPPYFSRVIMRAVPSAASRVTLLKSGQVQWIQRPLLQEVADLQKDKRTKAQEGFGRAISAVRMNTRYKPFDNKQVRQALNYAIDRGSLKRAVYFNTGDDAKSIIPPIVADYDPSFFKYDFNPDTAKQLLTEAKFDFDQQLELLYSGIFGWEESMSIQVAAQLGKIGVKVKPLRITDSDMRARSAPARQDLPFFAFEDGPIVLDPVYTLYLLAHSKGVSNRARFENPKMDALIDEARQTLDTAHRTDLVKQAQALWMDEAPWLLTLYASDFEAMAPSISGWIPYPDYHERWVDLHAT